MSFIKGATLFFLWTSVVLFMANAFEIVPTLPNALQYISQIILTQDGTNTSSTGIVLDGNGWDAWFSGDVTIASLPNKVCLWTDNSGKIVEGTCTWGGNDSKLGTGIEGRRCIFTGDKIVCDQYMPVWITWAKGDQWDTGPAWATWATWTFDGIETDPIFSGGDEGRRCILNAGKIECKQDTPAGGTWAQPAGEVNNIQFKAAGDVWSGSDWLVWKNNKLGIGIDNPTTDLQIFDYAYIGRDVLMSTWGNFLKILGSAPHTFGEVYTYTPNIQLNYQYYTSVSTFIDFNWQIKNNSNFLQFNFGTGREFAPKVAIWSGGSLGIGTPTPTEKFQIEDYIWMGQNTSVKTWGSFLRMYGLDLGNPALNDKPNVQLNYRTISYALPGGGSDTINDNNRQIKNNKDFLEFNFSTGGDYVNKFAIGLDGSAGIGGSMRIGGNMNVTSGRITLWYTGTDLDSFSGQSTPTNSMYISNKVVVWSPYLNNNEQNSNIKLIVRGGMKLGQIGTGDECNSYSFWTIGIQQTNDRPDWVPGEPSGWYDYKLVICLANLGGYGWRRLDNI